MQFPGPTPLLHASRSTDEGRSVGCNAVPAVGEDSGVTKGEVADEVAADEVADEVGLDGIVDKASEVAEGGAADEDARGEAADDVAKGEAADEAAVLSSVSRHPCRLGVRT